MGLNNDKVTERLQDLVDDMAQYYTEPILLHPREIERWCGVVNSVLKEMEQPNEREVNE